MARGIAIFKSNEYRNKRLSILFPLSLFSIYFPLEESMLSDRSIFMTIRFYIDKSERQSLTTSKPTTLRLRPARLTVDAALPLYSNFDLTYRRWSIPKLDSQRASRSSLAAASTFRHSYLVAGSIFSPASQRSRTRIGCCCSGVDVVGNNGARGEPAEAHRQPERLRGRQSRAGLAEPDAHAAAHPVADPAAGGHAGAGEPQSTQERQPAADAAADPAAGGSGTA